MKRRYCIAALLVPFLLSPVFSEDRIWTGGVDNDYLNAANWDSGVPNSDEDLAVINGGANQPVVISESITLGGFQLGTSGETGGHVIQNGGTVIVSPLDQSAEPTDFEFKSHIGDKGTLGSSWIMNNDSVMLFDGPLDGGGQGLGTDGVNRFDLEVGAATGEGVGRLELHDNAVLRISDDLKIGAEDNGNGFVRLDGNAVATIGSGISVGENENGIGVLEVAGNALLVSGNSAGPGLSDTGRTNEGYLTFSTDPTGIAEVTFSDSAKVYARSLQQRQGVTNLTIENSAELHVFDVFEFAEPNLGVASVFGSSSGSQRTSLLGADPSGEMTLTIKDNGVMSVDSELDDSDWFGLALSGGSNRGGNAEGGVTVVEVRDQGSFTVQQDLHLTLGTATEAESTLRVVGPDASVNVNGSLYFALDPSGQDNQGIATLHSVITSNDHATVMVTGEAEIANGSLAVDFDGYSPRGGESFTLLQAGTVSGDEFLETQLAELPEGLDWDLTIDGSSVVLSITGMLDNLLGDFDNQNGIEINDINALVLQVESGANDVAFDLNNDQVVDAADIGVWLSLKSAEGITILGGDTDLDGSVAFADFLNLSASFGMTETNWAQGNFDGTDGTAFADFLALSSNFGTEAGGIASVPEPDGRSLALLAFVGIGLIRRRSR